MNIKIHDESKDIHIAVDVHDNSKIVTNNEEVDQDDEDNAERLDDDKFENVEMIVKKDKEI